MVNVIVNEPSSENKNENRCPSRVDRCDSPSSARCVECFVNSGIVFSASIYRFYKDWSLVLNLKYNRSSPKEERWRQTQLVRDSYRPKPPVPPPEYFVNAFFL
jgi:hypothetical protein